MQSKDWVVVKATRKELHDIGICSEGTFEWLLNGKPKQVDRIQNTSKGTMVYLIGRSDIWCWVWQEMLVPAEKPRMQVVDDDDVNKIGPENHIPGGVRAINQACGIDKWSHRKENMLKPVEAKQAGKTIATALIIEANLKVHPDVADVQVTRMEGNQVDINVKMKMSLDRITVTVKQEG